MIEFSFFLDAWHYAFQHNIDRSKIKRLDWKTWVIDTKNEVKQPWKLELSKDEQNRQNLIIS